MPEHGLEGVPGVMWKHTPGGNLAPQVNSK
nr:MAG TPA: hypothetical protein [Bacteriophage sp.]